MRGLATLPQDNQEPLVVREKVGRPRWLGVSRSVGCEKFLFQYNLGWATGRAYGLQKAGCWFVDSDDLTGALHVLLLYSCNLHLHHPSLHQ